MPPKCSYIMVRKNSYSPPCNIWLCNFEHVKGCLVQTNEHTIVDLPQSEELQHFSGLGVDTIDTEVKMKYITT